MVTNAGQNDGPPESTDYALGDYAPDITLRNVVNCSTLQWVQKAWIKTDLEIIQKFLIPTCVTKTGGYHHKGDPTEDILKLVEQYDQCNVLQYQPGRQYACFPGFKRDLLAKLDVKQMANWMRTKLKHWEALYE